MFYPGFFSGKVKSISRETKTYFREEANVYDKAQKLKISGEGGQYRSPGGRGHPTPTLDKTLHIKLAAKLNEQMISFMRLRNHSMMDSLRKLNDQSASFSRNLLIGMD